MQAHDLWYLDEQLRLICLKTVMLWFDEMEPYTIVL